MSIKNRDNKNRWRSVTVGFRVSPEEAKKIDLAVSVSGMSKQDFLLSKVLDREILVETSSKVHRSVYLALDNILNELLRIESGQNIDDELLADIEFVTDLINRLYTA